MVKYYHKMRPVRSHTRFDPRMGKRVDVNSYMRNQRYANYPKASEIQIVRSSLREEGEEFAEGEEEMLIKAKKEGEPLLDGKAYAILEGYYLNQLYILPKYRNQGYFKKAIVELQEKVFFNEVYVGSVADFLVPSMKQLGWEEIIDPNEITEDGYINYWENDEGVVLKIGAHYNTLRKREEVLVPMKYDKR